MAKNYIHSTASADMTYPIYAGGTETRTQMLHNGLSTEWVAGDELAVWARNSSGEFTLSNQIFKTYGLDGARGFFTSDLAEPMPEDTYTYYCTYPVPVSVNGTSVTFSLPAVQDGKVTGGADIMIADPVMHGALTPVPEPEDHSGMRMSMNRMMHQFRFYIPEDNTVIGEEELQKIILTFPSDVAGKVTYDLADMDAAPALSESTGSLELQLAEPLGISGATPEYACLALVPSSFAEGEALQIKAYTEDKIAYFDAIDLQARTFEAGHSTPVMLMVKSVSEFPYRLTVKVGSNNLGEDPNSIRIQAPSGCIWPGSNSNVFTYAPGHKVRTGEEIVFKFEDEAQYRAFSNKTLSVTYDSDNTITYQSVKMPDLSSNDKGSISLTVPYLFYEDFSGIPSFNDGHDNPSVGMDSDTYKGITELSSKSSVLSGWYGTRIGGQSGTSIRICCRYEHVLLAGAYYKGRVYTPFLSGIKDGKDVNISVSFRYGSNRKERDPLLGSPPDKSPVMYFGINTQDPVINPDVNEGNIIDQITGLVGGSGFASSAPTSLSPMVIKGETLPKTGGSYTSFAGTKSVTVENVDNGMRLAWIISTDNTASNTNANYWLYIDDIKVSIAQ